MPRRRLLTALLLLVSTAALADPPPPVLNPPRGRPIRELRVTRDQPLTAVLEEISRQSGVRCEVDWSALPADDRNPDRVRVGDLTLHNVSARLALEIVLDHLVENPGLVADSDAEGRWLLTTEAGLKRLTVKRYYHFPGAAADPDAGDGLKRLLMETVDPTSWRDAGGLIGDARFWGPQLIITQTPANHRKIAALIDDLADPAPPSLPAARLDARYAALDRPVGRVDFAGLPLEDALARLAAAARVDVVPCWRALEAAGVDRRTPATVNLKRATLGQALRALLRRPDRDSDLTPGVVPYPDGRIAFATDDWVARKMLTVVYDVRPLIRGDSDRAEALVKLLEEMIDPTSWRDAGGSTGGVRFVEGRLIVTQTLDNQRAVAAMLAKLAP